MIIKYSMFGRTRLVKATPHNMQEDETHEKTLWVERGEDMYALSSPEFKGKKVAIVYREDWVRAKDI